MNNCTQLNLADFVDMARYPLDDDEAFAPILDECRKQLGKSSFVKLPGFLRPEVAQEMSREVLQAIPMAYRREKQFSAYDSVTADEALPADHPRRQLHPNRQYVVTTDILPPDGLIAELYHSSLLTGRIAQILNEKVLYTLEDPVMAATSTVMYDRDTHGWHFDLNDFVVSILLQNPESGGTFEFVPNIRGNGDENYHDVAAVMNGESDLVRSVPVEAGTLLIFCGREAIHRVSPVEGNQPRVVALFSYDRKPGVRYGSEVYMRVVGRPEPYAERGSPRQPALIMKAGQYDE